MGWYTEVEEMMKKDSSLGNCGVVGCYSTDSAGNVYLNGRLIRTKAEDDKYKLGLKTTQNQQEILLQNELEKLKEFQNKAVNKSSPNSINSILSKPLNLLAIGGALVLGYLAFKKFKK